MICTPADATVLSCNQDLAVMSWGGGGLFYWDSLVQDGVFPLLFKKNGLGLCKGTTSGAILRCQKLQLL